MPHYKRTFIGTRKDKRSNPTPGSVKGESCKASPLDKVLCYRNRSYKHPAYNDNKKISGVLAGAKRTGIM